eukprot:364536-Chlamydomonas_euryale.AAC.20
MASLACVPHAHHPACDRKTGWLLHVLLQITLSSPSTQFSMSPVSSTWIEDTIAYVRWDSVALPCTWVRSEVWKGFLMLRGHNGDAGHGLHW